MTHITVAIHSSVLVITVSHGTMYVMGPGTVPGVSMRKIVQLKVNQAFSSAPNLRFSLILKVSVICIAINITNA